MGVALEVGELPVLAHTADPFVAGRGYVRDALKDAGEVVMAALQDLTSGWGRIPESWQVEVGNLGEVLAVSVVSDHPGAAPHNYGASWPDKQPNITAIAEWLAQLGSDPQAAWIVSKTIQLKGIPAQNWTEQAIARTQSQVSAILADRGVKRWLQSLGSRGGA